MQTRSKAEQIRLLQCQQLKERAYSLSVECQSLWAGVSDDLLTAKATFTGSLVMLSELDTATLSEVKSLRSPPAAVQVCLFLPSASVSA